MIRIALGVEYEGLDSMVFKDKKVRRKLSKVI